MTNIFQAISSFVQKALTAVVVEEDMRADIQSIATTKLEDVRKLAQDELQRILDDEKRQPITYNHYYADNIQNARQKSLEQAIEKARTIKSNRKGKNLTDNTDVDLELLLIDLQRKVVNMDDQACLEAVDGLNAYYKVRNLLP